MTCAACANRIERKLNRLDGVAATVNFATEQASVDYDPSRAVGPDPGRRGRRVPRRVGARAAADVTRPDRLRIRLVLAAALSARSWCLRWLPLQFDGVGVARTRTRDPCRLVGRVAVPPRGRPERAPPRRHDGHADLDRHPRSLDLVRGRAAALDDAHTYFEVGAVITTLILLGRSRPVPADGRGPRSEPCWSSERRRRACSATDRRWSSRSRRSRRATGSSCDRASDSRRTA